MTETQTTNAAHESARWTFDTANERQLYRRKRYGSIHGWGYGRRETTEAQRRALKADKAQVRRDALLYLESLPWPVTVPEGNGFDSCVRTVLVPAEAVRVIDPERTTDVAVTVSVDIRVAESYSWTVNFRAGYRYQAKTNVRMNEKLATRLAGRPEVLAKLRERVLDEAGRKAHEELTRRRTRAEKGNLGRVLADLDLPELPRHQAEARSDGIRIHLTGLTREQAHEVLALAKTMGVLDC